MRFRESPPNSRLTTLYCILHPSNLYFAQSPGPGSGWRDHRPCPSLLLYSVAISTLCPHACLSLLPLSLPLSVVILAWPLGPPTSGQSTCLRRKPSFQGPNKGGWTPILLCCATAVQHSNGNAVEPAATGERAAASFARVWVLAALGDDSAAGATAEQRQYGDGGGSLLPGTLPSPNPRLGQSKASGGRFGSVISVAIENQWLMTVSFGQARRPRYPTNSTPSWRRRRRRPPPPPLPLELPTGPLLCYRRSLENRTDKEREDRSIGSWTSRLAWSKVRRVCFVRP